MKYLKLWESFQDPFLNYKLPLQVKDSVKNINRDVGEKLLHVDLENALIDDKLEDVTVAYDTLSDFYELGKNTGSSWVQYWGDPNTPAGNYHLNEAIYLGLIYFKGEIMGDYSSDDIPMLAATKPVWNKIGFIIWARSAGTPDELIKQCLQDPAKIETLSTYNQFGFFDK